MASTYSSILNLEIQTTGENSGTWGTITNNNLQKLEAALKGYVSVAVRESVVLAIATETYPLIAASSFCRLLFVIVPQVPEFSPVVWISRLRILEYVEAIYSSLCHIIY